MSSFSDGAKWAIATASLNDRRTFYRVCTERPRLPNLRSFRTSVVIEWIFDPSETVDVPTGETAAAIDAFEEAIIKLGAEDSHTLMACVTTGAGMKEWLYYTQSYESFSADLNRMLSEHREFPITIMYDDDPDWLYWGTILERLSRRSTGKS